MELRRLYEDDAEIYWAFRLEALKENPEAFAATYEETVESEYLERIKENFKSDSSVTFGIFHEGELVASAVLRFFMIEKLRHKADLLAMYVSPKHRSHGCGRKLIEAVIGEAKKRNMEQVQLAVVNNNKAAMEFYHSLGFKTFGSEKMALKYKGEYWDEEHMVLYL